VSAIQLVYHVYIMTYQEYTDTLYAVSLEIGMQREEQNMIGTYPHERYSENYTNIALLRSYRAKLVSWWYGSRVGSEPTWPTLIGEYGDKW
jgi:hypothetical protein